MNGTPAFLKVHYCHPIIKLHDLWWANWTRDLLRFLPSSSPNRSFLFLWFSRTNHRHFRNSLCFDRSEFKTTYLNSSKKPYKYVIYYVILKEQKKKVMLYTLPVTELGICPGRGEGARNRNLTPIKGTSQFCWNQFDLVRIWSPMIYQSTMLYR